MDKKTKKILILIIGVLLIATIDQLTIYIIKMIHLNIYILSHKENFVNMLHLVLVGFWII